MSSKQTVVIMKLPTGSPEPGRGYTLVRSLKGIDIYNKKVVQITKQDIDDLSSMFGNVGVSNKNVLIVPEEQTDAAMDFLIGSMGSIGLGGKMRKTKKSTFRKNKMKRKTRRHRR